MDVEQTVKNRMYQCEYQRKLRKNNPNFARDRNRKKRYGITPGEYERMLEEQGNICPICLEDGKGDWHVDHCHSTGKVRSILCRQCNLMLGNGRDNAEILVRAAQYVLEHMEGANNDTTCGHTEEGHTIHSVEGQNNGA